MLKEMLNFITWATHGHTASEVIYERANFEKPFMGLTTFKGDIPVLSDVVIAKNYLSEEELKVLNNLVSEYKKYQVKTISPIEKEYLEALKKINSKIEKEDKK